MKKFGQGFSLHQQDADLPNKEKAQRNISARTMKSAVEAELLLQWGSRKRLRCMRVRSHNFAQSSNNNNNNNNTNASSSSRTRRRLTSRFLTVSHKAEFVPQSRHLRNFETETRRSENRRSSSRSPEKEERYYPTRGSSMVLIEDDNNSKIVINGGAEDQSHQIMKKSVWPRLCIALSSKEKEEDFLAMKGCKLPQRPKKRAKLVQRSLLLVSPGAWLTDMSLERYEVREKKSSKRKARGGLKAMGSIESDSD